jgi:hypothetical protein
MDKDFIKEFMTITGKEVGDLLAIVDGVKEKFSKFGAAYLLDFGTVDYRIKTTPVENAPPSHRQEAHSVSFNMYFVCKECKEGLCQLEVWIPTDFFVPDFFSTVENTKKSNLSHIVDHIVKRITHDLNPWYDRYTFDAVMNHSDDCEGFKERVAYGNLLDR